MREGQASSIEGMFGQAQCKSIREWRKLLALMREWRARRALLEANACNRLIKTVWFVSKSQEDIQRAAGLLELTSDISKLVKLRCLTLKLLDNDNDDALPESISRLQELKNLTIGTVWNLKLPNGLGTLSIMTSLHVTCGFDLRLPADLQVTHLSHSCHTQTRGKGAGTVMRRVPFHK